MKERGQGHGRRTTRRKAVKANNNMQKLAMKANQILDSLPRKVADQEPKPEHPTSGFIAVIERLAESGMIELEEVEQTKRA